MGKQKVEIYVYGTEQICASCVGMPSSKETYEWLQAAIGRKYPDQPFEIRYVDFQNPPEGEKESAFSERVIEEDLIYPVIVIDDEIIAEGNPRLKDIYKVMAGYGYEEVNN